MMERLLRLFSSEGGRDAQNAKTDELRVASAALLVHAAYIDGCVDLVEENRIKKLLAQNFDLSASDVAALMPIAEREESEAVDLYRFTKVLTDRLDPDGRKEIVRMLWEVVLTDGVLTDYEDNLVRKVGDLLGVSTRDRVRLRKEVEHARGQTSSGQ